MIEFDGTMGVEFSAVPRFYDEDRTGYPCDFAHDMIAGLGRLVIFRMNQRLPDEQKLPISRYQDGHCVEIPSPVFKSRRQLERFAKMLFAQFRAASLLPTHSKTVCGGGHIHFGIEDDNEQAAIIFDFCHQWFVPLIFLEPNDTSSGNHYWLNDSIIPTELSQFCQYIFLAGEQDSMAAYLYMTGGNEFQGFVRQDASKIRRAFYNNKDLAIAINNNGQTLEFRCVQAPRNMVEFKDQLDFFISYVNLVLNKYRSTKEFRPLPAPWRNLSKRRAIAQFKSLLRELNLPYERYEKYVKRNLMPRAKLS